MPDPTVCEPSLGILTHALHTEATGELAGPLTPYVRDLVDAARRLGWTAYVYSPRDLLKRRRVVWGWTREHGAWQRDFFPIPQVSYLRSVYWHAEDAATVRWLKQEAGTQFLADPDVEEIVHDRWRVVQIGLSHPTVSERFPDTLLVRPGADLRTALSEQAAWTVVPRYRSADAAYAFVARQGDAYTLRFLARQVAHTQTLKSAAELQERLLQLFGEAVVQAYGKPLRFESCPVSVRSVWQRGASARWEELCQLVRVGKEHERIGPMTTAAPVTACLPLFEQAAGSRTQALRYQLSQTARSAVELIDQRGHGASELAVDLIPLADGGVRIADISTVGGIESLRRLAQPELRQASIAATLGYAATRTAQGTVLSAPSPVLQRTG